jgi:hypothetical protein
MSASPAQAQPEKLYDCPLCGRGKFGARGLALHHCPQMPRMHTGRHDRLPVTLTHPLTENNAEAFFTALADLARRGTRPIQPMANKWARLALKFQAASNLNRRHNHA